MSSPRRFDIQPQSGVRIDQQLVEQAGALIAGGRLAPGDLLRSVREVARSADINPMTVSKTYSKLEADDLCRRWDLPLEQRSGLLSVGQRQTPGLVLALRCLRRSAPCCTVRRTGVGARWKSADRR